MLDAALDNGGVDSLPRLALPASGVGLAAFKFGFGVQDSQCPDFPVAVLYRRAQGMAAGAASGCRYRLGRPRDA